MDLDKIKAFVISNKIRLSLGVLLLVILIGLLIYLTRDKSHVVLYDSNKLFYGDREILVGLENTKPSPENIQYSLSIFLRVNNLARNTIWNEGTTTKKFILENGGSPNITYNVNTGIISVEIAYKDKDGVNDIYSFDLEHFPLQKWTHLCIVVNGKDIRLYKDGVLFKGKKLNTIPWRAQGMLFIGKNNKNFNGHIGLIDYYNRPLSNKEIVKLYNKRKHHLPTKNLTYEQEQYLNKKNTIRGKVDKVAKF